MKLYKYKNYYVLTDRVIVRKDFDLVSVNNLKGIKFDSDWYPDYGKPNKGGSPLVQKLMGPSTKKNYNLFDRSTQIIAPLLVDSECKFLKWCEVPKNKIISFNNDLIKKNIDKTKSEMKGGDNSQQEKYLYTPDIKGSIKTTPNITKPKNIKSKNWDILDPKFNAF